ncbi:MAG: hypothetical protein NT169_11620 [Chloroflexi bacterium]|nr:hypothetical protein [Chloroflexota bacterium]
MKVLSQATGGYFQDKNPIPRRGSSLVSRRGVLFAVNPLRVTAGEVCDTIQIPNT